MTALMTSGPETARVKEWANQIRTLRQKVLTEVGHVVVGMEMSSTQTPHRAVGRRPRAARRRARRREDTLSKAFARHWAASISAMQFTPDLLPSDVTGTSIFDRKANEFVLRKGPIFCQVLLADEINRARPKRNRACWRRCRNIR